MTEADAGIEGYPNMARYLELGYVMELAVHPRYQGQGIGSGLLKWAEARLGHPYAQG